MLLVEALARVERNADDQSELLKFCSAEKNNCRYMTTKLVKLNQQKSIRRVAHVVID
jgi:hypothetical protein